MYPFNVQYSHLSAHGTICEMARGRRAIISGWMLIAAALGFVGPATAGKPDDTLVVAFQRAIDNLDRLYTVRREMLILAQLTDDGLFYVDPDTLDYVPLAAKSYRYADDTTLDVTVRNGVTFHDGSPLTADDVVYTYRWLLNKKALTRQGRRIARWLRRVEKTGPMTVRFRLEYPYPLALRDMAVSVPLRRKGTYHPDADGKSDSGTQRPALNGLGPYKVTAFEPGKNVAVERFEGYYKDSPKGRPAIRRIVIRTIPDWGTQQAELITGGVDWMYDIPADVARNIGKTPRATRLNGPSMRIFWINMDAAGHTGEDNPMTRLDVRRAINHAINRKSIVENIVRGTSRVIHAACHPAQFGCYQDVRKYEYDPEKAKALLRKAGYPNGFTFEFWAYRQRQVAEAVMADLAKVGITARLRYVKAGTLGLARRSREVQSYFASWGSGSTADTSMIAGQHWVLKSSRNLSGDEAVEKAVLAAERTFEPKKRQAAFRAALTRIAEQAYWAPLYAGTLDYLVGPKVDFTPPKDGLPRLFLVKWK